MSASMWAYNEKVCDGEVCRNDCDICPARDEAMEGDDDETEETTEPCEQ